MPAKGTKIRKYLPWVLGVCVLSGLGLIYLLSQAIEQQENAVVINPRTMMFGLMPQDIGIEKTTFTHPVWGVMMERGFAKGSDSLVSLADGSAGLYYSHGGGIKGNGDAQVTEAAAYLLSGAQHFYRHASKVTEYPLPRAGEVRFYFLTFDGVMSYAVPEEKLRAGRDALSALFVAAHALINDLQGQAMGQKVVPSS